MKKRKKNKLKRRKIILAASVDCSNYASERSEKLTRIYEIIEEILDAEKAVRLHAKTIKYIEDIKIFTKKQKNDEINQKEKEKQDLIIEKETLIDKLKDVKNPSIKEKIQKKIKIINKDINSINAKVDLLQFSRKKLNDVEKDFENLLNNENKTINKLEAEKTELEEQIKELEDNCP